MNLPTFETYGNYGAHALVFTIAGDRFWFSYRTLIAFTSEGRRFVRQNDWSSTTTGKHLNSIDGGDKKARLPSSEFEAAYARAYDNKIRVQRIHEG